jgi:RimJ/RimL family protein N-acetyltransferase
MSADMDALRPAMTEGTLRLEPMTEAHGIGLAAACAADTEIWAIYPVDWSPTHFDGSFADALASPRRIGFVILLDEQVVGMSAFLNTEAGDRSVEIGSTYFVPTVRGTGLNGRVKRLMLDRAGAAGFHRIEFRVDTRNTRSMAAVEKLGAVREGTLRRNRVTWTGYVRDTAIFALFIGDTD